MPQLLPAPALVLDTDGLVEAVNARAATLLARAPSDLVGRRLPDLLPAIAAAQVRITRAEREDGRILCTLTEVGEGDGLLASLAPNLGAAFDHSPIGLAFIDVEGRYVHVNDAHCAILGRPREEVIGTRDPDLTHPDDVVRQREIALRIESGELDASQHEKRFVRPDGSVRWVVSAVAFLRDADGHGLGWFGQWTDITARRAAEEALRRERDLSRATLAAMHEGFCLTREGVVLDVNDALCAITGFPREELVGTLLPFPWTPPESLEQVAEMQRAFRAAGGGEAEVECVRRDGRRFLASVTSAEVTGPDGERLGFVHTMRDVTAERRQKEELARLATHDALTGLGNHRAFHEHLRGEVARAERAGTPLSLAILDLDHFKAINDHHGHPVGDCVLAEVGRRFRLLTRAGEHIARIGGEEFAWVLPGATGAQAFAAAERARRAIEAVPFDGVGPVTLSIGVCELADAGGAAEELHRLADVALYWAKAHGRNLVFRWTPDTAGELDGLAAAPAPASAARLEALRAVAYAIDEDRPAGPGHPERVAELAGRLAAVLGWPHDRIARLREAAELHDVGKATLPQALLRKPGAFTAEEWEQVRRHPATGADMLDGVLDEEQRSWVRAHHERWDGAGYPEGLAAAAVPDGARVLAVADAYDAMTSRRPYSAARSAVDAVFEVREGAGGQFDPDVAEALITLLAGAPA